MCVYSESQTYFRMFVFQHDLYGGVSLQAVSKAAGVTEDLQLERFFSILQVIESEIQGGGLRCLIARPK